MAEGVKVGMQMQMEEGLRDDDEDGDELWGIICRHNMTGR